MTPTPPSSTPAPQPQQPHPPTPLTLLTGFLGSGKTTTLLSLLPQLPPHYTLALLKNEFGDLALDTQLASNAAIAGVQELTGGCICCNLVGGLGDALGVLREGSVGVDDGGGKGKGEEKRTGRRRRRPDRIVIETSGSAFPATLVLELNRLIRLSTQNPANNGVPAYTLDGVLSIIDVENWAGYADTSVTASMQARFTDLVVLNKWENAGESRVEWVRDRLGDLSAGGGVPTPVVWSQRGRVDLGVVFGIDGGLAGRLGVEDKELTHEHGHGHKHGHKHNDATKESAGAESHQNEVEVLSATLTLTHDPTQGASTKPHAVSLTKLNTLLTSAPKDEIYRIKAIIHLSPASIPKNSDDTSAVGAPSSTASSNGTGENVLAKYILNWAFGRWTWTYMGPGGDGEKADGGGGDVLRMTIITARYESAKWKRRIEGEGLLALEGDDGGGSGGLLRIEKIG